MVDLQAGIAVDSRGGDAYVTEVEDTPVRIGTAGWRIPKELRDGFPDWGDRTQLWGYARRLDAVEINKTFDGLPMAPTFGRWRDRVPEHFRFSLKAPRQITHDRRLEDVDQPVEAFLDRADEDGRPGADRETVYFRLHGTPETYRSPYRGHGLEAWGERVREAAANAGEVWCIFDNTAEGEGTADALELRKRVGE